jgi:hypothetical protein
MNRSRPRPLSRLLLVLAAVAAVVVGLVGPAAAAAPFCGITWGSLPKDVGATSDPGVAITNVRAGQHACYDRLVVDLNRSAGFGGWSVEYGTVAGESGVPVPLRGGAALRVVVHAPASDLNGNPTYTFTNARELVDVGGYQTFRQVAFVDEFEGYTTLGLGVRARLPFRVFLIPGSPGRMVLDVAHHW